MKIKKTYTLIIFICFTCNIGRSENSISDSLQKQLINILNQNLHSQQRWPKVHTAEFLLSLGYSKEIKRVFKIEEELHGNEKKYRIGIWRVLYKATSKNKEKRSWEEKILEAYTDKSGKDRIHAAETLAKLGIRVDLRAPQVTKQILDGYNEILKAYVYWSMSLPNNATQEANLNKLFNLLKSNNIKIRGIAAYALRHHGNISKSDWDKLSQLSLLKSQNPLVKINLLTAALVTAPTSKERTVRYSKIKLELLETRFSDNVNLNFHLCEALALSGNKQSLLILSRLIKKGQIRDKAIDDVKKSSEYGYNTDVESAAAYAFLRIKNRNSQ